MTTDRTLYPEGWDEGGPDDDDSADHPEDGQPAACRHCGAPIEACTDCEGTKHAVHSGAAIRWHACATRGTVAEAAEAPAVTGEAQEGRNLTTAQRAVHRDIERREAVSGRSEPRQTGHVTHDVRFYGALTGDLELPAIGMAARCEPCAWSASIEGGHTAGELVRLAEQHCGVVTA